MDPTPLAQATLVQLTDDIVQSHAYRFQAASPVPPNGIGSLTDDVAMPVGAFHVHGRLSRPHRYDFIVLADLRAMAYL